MKKIIFTLLALVGTMSMNAQIVKLYKGDVLVTSYDASQVDNVVFEKAPAATTGTAKATIGGEDVDVNWVQLWENGPKFAEYNVFVSSDPEIDSTMTFTEATMAGADYVWGANWCTPSQDQMDELLKAATSDGSEKVKCEYTQENSVWGFKFTGLTDGYTSNSVFFPSMGGDSNSGGARYWSATAADGGKGLYMDLYCGYTPWGDFNWDSKWKSFFTKAYVRPVLKN